MKRATIAEKLLVALLSTLADPWPDAWRLIRTSRELFATNEQSAIPITQEAKAFLDATHAILAAHRPDLNATLSAEQHQITGALLEQTANAYYWSAYQRGFSGRRAELHANQALALLDLALCYVDHSSIVHSLPTTRTIHMERQLTSSAA